MNTVQCSADLLAAQHPTFQRKLDWTRQIIADALRKEVRWYIAFSGGIDSTVLLDLVWQAQHGISVLWGDDGADFAETLDFLAATEQRYGFALQRIRSLDSWRDWCHEMARPDLALPGPDMDAAWLNPLRWQETWPSLKAARQHGYGGVFLGLLARESRGRRMILHGGSRPLYQVKEEQDMWHCSPLAAWTKEDIWAFVALGALPYNTVYDRLTSLGIPREQCRVAPLTCFRVMQYGSHAILRRGWPDLYHRLAETFPALTRYA